MRKFNTVVIRYSELGLKSPPIRRQLEDRLLRNLEETYRREGIYFLGIRRRRSRIIVYTDDPRVREVTKLVFGVKNFSPALEADLDASTLRAALRSITEGGAGYRPVIRGSGEIRRKLQDSINGIEGLGDSVQPKRDLILEMIGNRVYLTDEVIEGPGGLPAGTQGRVVALISSGLDSPVATWLMMRRGAEIIPVHFRKSEWEEEAFRRLVKILDRYSSGTLRDPIILDHESKLGRYAKAREWTCVLCKRRMILEANRIAKEVGAGAIVTGDSLGQVASQTLDNLEIESRCIEKPVLRPLIGMDKEEVVRIAKEIGTYEVSIRYDMKCEFVPKKPKVKSNWNEFVKVVKGLGEEELITECKGA